MKDISQMTEDEINKALLDEMAKRPPGPRYEMTKILPDDRKRLRQIAEERGKSMTDVLHDLIQGALQ